MGTSAPLTHCLIVSPRLPDDPRARALLTDAHALGISSVESIQSHDLYFIEGDVVSEDLQRLSLDLLSDPLTQQSTCREAAPRDLPSSTYVLDVALRPGVTDPVADQIVRCAHLLGVHGVQRAATGQRYVIQGELSQDDLHRLARRLLANDVIQRYAIGEIEPIFPHLAEATGTVVIIPLRGLEEPELIALSRQRRAALDLREMQAVQHYFRSVGRDPSDVEFETIAQTWSEHCVHKTFKARIHVSEVGRRRNEGANAISASPSAGVAVVDGLLKTYIRSATESINAPWVRSAFVDNAGIIDFDDEYEMSFKVETHNHPSAIEPFGGANTGVGGVIRDVLGVSAKPIAATDVLCFGPQDLDAATLPDGVLHPRRVRSGVVAGVQDYGNKIGIPTVSGAILYDEGYTANPLVFCGCVGLAPKGVHPREPLPGDHVVVLGGRTGRDGLRGATFSSMTMDAQTGEVAGASVQIGDPITEKGVIEVIVRARMKALYHAITDCGAGGLSSAVGEMASHTGADVELRHVRLKYPGLAPWEIWLSEAQERMVLAVPESACAELQSLCDTFDVELTDIGVFTGTGRLVVRYDDRIVLDLENDFLHDGLPQRVLIATVANHARDLGVLSSEQTSDNADHDPAAHLLSMLSSPNIASKADVIRVYDHEVQGGTVVKPLTGFLDDGPSDAVVLKPLGTHGMRGIVLSCGINPEYGKRDAYGMAVSVVDEAIRNAVSAGADPSHIALLDNFCWGDPNRPETLGALVEAARGCHDAALYYSAPFISGKDSLNNEYVGADGLRHAIPPTLLISAIGIIEDVSRAVTTDLKEPGNIIFWVGRVPDKNDAVPGLPVGAPGLYQSLHRAMQAGHVRACHDLSEGGLAVAASEMCIGGRLGMSLDAGESYMPMFAEVSGSFLVEVEPGDCAAFESNFAGEPVRRIGFVNGERRLSIVRGGLTMLSLDIETLRAAWQREGKVWQGR